MLMHQRWFRKDILFNITSVRGKNHDYTANVLCQTMREEAKFAD